MYYIKIGDSYVEIGDVIKLTNDHFILKNTAENRYKVKCLKNTVEVMKVSDRHGYIKRFYKMATIIRETEIDIMLGAKL